MASPDCSAILGGTQVFKNILYPTSKCQDLNQVKGLLRQAVKECPLKKSCTSSLKESSQCQNLRKLLCNPYCQANMVKAVQKPENKGGALAQAKWQNEIEPLYRKYFGHASAAINFFVKQRCEGDNCIPGTEPKLRFFKSDVTNKPRVFILSVDGGGIKGIIPAYVLLKIEQRVKKLLIEGGYAQKAETFMLSDVFTLGAGTSTGGLIVLYLNARNPVTGKTYKTEGLIPLYEGIGEKVFHSGSLLRRLRGAGGVLTSRHSAKPLEAILREKLGDQTLAFTKNFVLVTSTDVKKNIPFIFSSLRAIQSNSRVIKNENNKRVNLNYFLWEAARATSAAPTFFKPFTVSVGNNETVTLVDGGVGANNPIGFSYHEIGNLIYLYTGLSINDVEVIIISLSTGRDDFEIPNQNFQGAFGGGVVQVLGNTLSSLMTIPNDLYQSYVDSTLSGDRGRVFRIEGGFKEFTPFNVATKEALAYLKSEAISLINQQREEIEEISRLIYQSVIRGPYQIKMRKKPDYDLYDKKSESISFLGNERASNVASSVPPPLPPRRQIRQKYQTPSFFPSRRGEIKGQNVSSSGAPPLPPRSRTMDNRGASDAVVPPPLPPRNPTLKRSFTTDQPSRGGSRQRSRSLSSVSPVRGQSTERRSASVGPTVRSSIGPRSQSKSGSSAHSFLPQPQKIGAYKQCHPLALASCQSLGHSFDYPAVVIETKNDHSMGLRAFSTPLKKPVPRGALRAWNRHGKSVGDIVCITGLYQQTQDPQRTQVWAAEYIPTSVSCE
jgi:hypothetical protein